MISQTLPTSAFDYSRSQRAEIAAALHAVDVEWAKVGRDFDMGWARIAPTVLAILEQAQRRIARESVTYIPDVLEETNQLAAVGSDYVTDPDSIVGWAGSGLPVYSTVGWAPVRAKQAVEEGATPGAALRIAGNWLSLTSGTILSDTGRHIERAQMGTRRVGGYIRMLNPPSCSRCAVLAGKWYRSNAGFLRHPFCDCRHVPASEAVGNDMRLDVDAYFHSLDEAGQRKLAGSAANAQAVRDGADLTQIVNAYHRTAGMRFAQVSPIRADAQGLKFTTAGTTRRARAAQQQAGLRRNGPLQQRLMPESIAVRAKNAEDRIRLLKLNGWIRDDDAAGRGRQVFADLRRSERNARARERRLKRA